MFSIHSVNIMQSFIILHLYNDTLQKPLPNLFLGHFLLEYTPQMKIQLEATNLTKGIRVGNVSGTLRCKPSLICPFWWTLPQTKCVTVMILSLSHFQGPKTTQTKLLCNLEAETGEGLFRIFSEQCRPYWMLHNEKGSTCQSWHQTGYFHGHSLPENASQNEVRCQAGYFHGHALSENASQNEVMPFPPDYNVWLLPDDCKIPNVIELQAKWLRVP